MAALHPLDRPIWAMLSGARQAPLAIVRGRARRLRPEYGIFVVAEDEAGYDDLGELVRAHGPAVIVERAPPPEVPGTVVAGRGELVQMLAEAITPGPAPGFEIVALGDPEAAEMLALATLTRPGPFVARTHELGDFVGVKDAEGRLIAMAGERMKPDGFTEVSGVCTHPDHRGRGYAAALMRRVAGRILARGETPFLHAYAANTGAIGLYRSLGFEVRCDMAMTSLEAI